MKKIISFEKELDFPSMIGEITSISLDNTLKFVDKSNIEGSFFVSGTYKMTEASTLEEKFNYDIPVEISLTEDFDLNDVDVSIDNFHYEILNDDILKCNISVLIDGIEEVLIEEEKEEQKEEKEELRECDGDKKEEKELDMEKLDEEEKKEEINIEENNNIITKEELKNEEEDDTVEEDKNISSLFETLSTSEETFTTYSIYILRKEDTIEKIMDKYKITKEELSDYNDLNNLEIGSKVIIPSTNE